MGRSESASISGGSVDDILVHISEKPWSDYTAADYTVEQWHTACLIHQHEGIPTSKGQCKLPVRTPSGAINRHGVYAAAAVLAGARGGVDASEDEKATAARVLIQMYKDMDKEPPPSLLTHSSDQILAHYGRLGMRWGHRSRTQPKVSDSTGGSPVMITSHPKKGIIKTSGGEGHPLSDEAKRSASYRQVIRKSSVDALSNDQLQKVVKRMELEQKYRKAITQEPTKSIGRKFVLHLLKVEGPGLLTGKHGPITTFGKKLFKEQSKASKIVKPKAFKVL